MHFLLFSHHLCLCFAWPHFAFARQRLVQPLPCGAALRRAFALLVAAGLSLRNAILRPAIAKRCFALLCLCGAMRAMLCRSSAMLSSAFALRGHAVLCLCHALQNSAELGSSIALPLPCHAVLYFAFAMPSYTMLRLCIAKPCNAKL